MNDKSKTPQNSQNSQTLHGNSARINPKKSVVPQLGSCFGAVTGDFTDPRINRPFGRTYNRLDNFDDGDAEFWKDIVDSNPL